jgi:hypothetical protein
LAIDSTTGTYGTPASFTLLNDHYAIKGAWVTNSTWAYQNMTQGGAPASPFTAGSWYKVVATGYDAADKEIGTTEIYLANYKTDSDKPVSDWIWFDLTPLKAAVKILFVPESSDSGERGMNTAAYFCMDGITLVEK